MTKEKLNVTFLVSLVIETEARSRGFLVESTTKTL